MCNVKKELIMGHELCYTRNKEIRRKGTTFSEIQDVFINNITSKFIYEPLACCKVTDDPNEVKRILKEKDFDVSGVIDEKENKIGFIKQSELEHQRITESINPFSLNNVISESTPITELIEILSNNEYTFILSKNSIEGIVTRADINKPIIRIYLFGIISLFELHLNFWISHYHTEQSWSRLIKTPRLKKANGIYNKRKGNNIQLNLLECIQICDKREILLNTPDFLNLFEFTHPEFKKFLERAEIIRNEIAHSQNSIIDNLEWNDFENTIKEMKCFLEQSEIKMIK